MRPMDEQSQGRNIYLGYDSLNLGLLAKPNAYYDSTLKLSECNVRRVLNTERACTMSGVGDCILPMDAISLPYSDPIEET